MTTVTSKPKITWEKLPDDFPLLLLCNQKLEVEKINPKSRIDKLNG